MDYFKGVVKDSDTANEAEEEERRAKVEAEREAKEKAKRDASTSLLFHLQPCIFKH